MFGLRPAIDLGTLWGARYFSYYTFYYEPLPLKGACKLVSSSIFIIYTYIVFNSYSHFLAWNFVCWHKQQRRRRRRRGQHRSTFLIDKFVRVISFLLFVPNRFVFVVEFSVFNTNDNTTKKQHNKRNCVRFFIYYFIDQVRKNNNNKEKECCVRAWWWKKKRWFVWRTLEKWMVIKKKITTDKTKQSENGPRRKEPRSHTDTNKIRARPMTWAERERRRRSKRIK